MTNRMQPFAILTHDQAWIDRNHATPSPKGDGRVIVTIPEGQIERHTFAGVAMMRHVFADKPADAWNAAIACPIKFVA